MQHAARIKHDSASKSTYIWTLGSYLSLYGVLFLNFVPEIAGNTGQIFLKDDFDRFLTGNKSTFGDIFRQIVIFEKRTPYSSSQTYF